MISLLLNGFLFRSLCRGPCAIIAAIGAIFAICGCIRCLRCRLRDCGICKRFLRATGHDKFDDFELMLLVHEAKFERSHAKVQTVVRVTAGRHHVRTDPNSNGIFQQPLNISVEQGTEKVNVDLLDNYDRVIATLRLDVMENLLKPENHRPESTYTMKEKVKGIRNPKIKLTVNIEHERDIEKGLLCEGSSDLDSLVRLQLSKARKGRSDGDNLSELQVFQEACSGPLEMFESLGNTTKVYVSVLGPPVSRRWILAIWEDEQDYKHKKGAMIEVDMMKIQSVQADPTRHHVFVVNYYDESRVPQTCTFRRTDRARDVWVEIMHQLVQTIREVRQEQKNKRERSLKGNRSRS